MQQLSSCYKHRMAASAIENTKIINCADFKRIARPFLEEMNAMESKSNKIRDEVGNCDFCFVLFCTLREVQVRRE